MAETDRLLELLRERSFERGTFTLTSGRQSDFFIDCKRTVLTAEGHVLVGRSLLRAARRFQPAPQAVAGVVLGGCPLASAVAYASHQLSGATSLDAILVRKEAKGHGSQRRLEGATHLPRGTPVVVVEDTVTTGGSTLQAVAALREADLRISGVLAVVDRREGAADAFADAGLAFAALYGREDFMGAA